MMKKALKITIHQINSYPGNFTVNQNKIDEGIDRAFESKSDLLIYPAQSITGMNPNALFKKDHFLKCAQKILIHIANRVQNSSLAVLISCPNAFDEPYEKPFLINNQGICDVIHDQKGILDINGQRVLLLEDSPNKAFKLPKRCFSKNALIVHLNTRPFHTGIQLERERTGEFIAMHTGNRFLEVNRVGTIDHLVYYGASFLKCDKKGTCIRAKSFKEDLITFELDFDQGTGTICDLPDHVSSQYSAIIQSISDYIHKNGFKKVLVGLSGGLDSALVTTLAVQALGSENVFCLMMPSQFSSSGSVTDSEKLVQNLDIQSVKIPITEVYHCIHHAINPFFGERTFNTTDENMQARIRGLYLMTVSNEYGWVVLNTGNKSETATGYSTLYGDTVGGYAPISDLYKTECYQLASFINSMKRYDCIPIEILQKAPSAELSPGQTDQDSLPAYDQLDGILQCILDENLSYQVIIERGFEERDVQKTFRLLRINEYKRRQEPLGPRLSMSSFVHDIDFPITNGFKEEL